MFMFHASDVDVSNTHFMHGLALGLACRAASFRYRLTLVARHSIEDSRDSLLLLELHDQWGAGSRTNAYAALTAKIRPKSL